MKKKKFLTYLSFAISLVLLPPALQAQSQDVAYGRLTVSFNASFQSWIASMGIVVTDLNGNALQNGSTTFTGVGGALDVTTSVGELLHSGGYLISINGAHVELSSPVIDTTSPHAPVITVLVVVNGAVVGRMPLFALVAPAGLSTPYPVNAGTVQLTGIQVNLTPQIANELNGLLGANVIPAGITAGTESQYSVFSSNSGS